jgi:hypothetical protein
MEALDPQYAFEARLPVLLGVGTIALGSFALYHQDQNTKMATSGRFQMYNEEPDTMSLIKQVVARPHASTMIIEVTTTTTQSRTSHYEEQEHLPSAFHVTGTLPYAHTSHITHAHTCSIVRNFQRKIRSWYVE